MSLHRSTLFLLAGAGLLVACGDDGTGPEERTIKENPSFVADIVEITHRRGCTASQCHGGSAGGMDLGAPARTYESWVGVPASGDPDEIRVIPGNAQDSYVVKKLEGRQTVGERMPLGMTPLDEIDLTNIRNWIDNGAPNN